MTIEEAKLRFPPGTLFNNRNIVPDARNLPAEVIGFFEKRSGGNIVVKSTKSIGQDFYYTIYNAKMDMWANIIHTEGESAPVNNYSIY